jgi:hypothetical protein
MKCSTRNWPSFIGRHADKMTSEEVLAVGANMLGKLLAYQDQRTMTRERAMEIIIQNIEMGNQQAIAEVMNSRGTA